MFFSLNTIKKPSKCFNLLHLETSENYFLSLKVSMHINQKYDEIRGKLHLCSRSLIFDPKNTRLPLIKMKYSNNLVMKILKNVDFKTIYQVSTIRWNYQLLQEDVENLDLNQLYNYQRKEAQKHPEKSTLNELIERLMITNPNQKRQLPIIQQSQNAFFIKVDKIFVVNRDPISPYLTEKSDDNFIFSISKSNSKQNVIRFLKIYEGVVQCQDETEFMDVVIQTTLNEGISEYKQMSKKVDFIYKVKRITPEGVVHGILTMMNEQWIQFLPLVNSPSGKIVDIKVSDVKFFLKYRYMFQRTGIEMWIYNKKRSLLFVFEDHNTQESVFRTLNKKCLKAALQDITLDKCTELWTTGGITNFEYLMLLNTFANRSFNDLSAYPVFPWIINEYHNKEFAINQQAFFRDLSKPIGALNKHRLKKYKDYLQDQLKEKNRDMPPYLYPTHYSSPGTVVYYLIRKVPEFVIKLQNGVFGPTDRIFRGVDSTWYTTLNLHADSKEMIPEFFYLDGDFLVNCDKLELGVTQDGEIIDDAVLPVWAKDLPDFMVKMRQALESDYVTLNIHKWIDLIFGSKQNGDQALQADNLFYPLTYEENVRWDKCRNQIERQALEVQVAEFGQVPVRLFQQGHPQRKIKISAPIKNLEEQKATLTLKVHQLQNQNNKLTAELEKKQSEKQGKQYEDEAIYQLKQMVENLQQENDKLRFNLESVKHEMEQNNKDKIETFNSNFENIVVVNFNKSNYIKFQDDIDQNDFDFLNDESNVANHF